tara:strand:+ start:1573 stop:1800 length:228 start_codon:yes stop_codon:yes gene_type:complete
MSKKKTLVEQAIAIAPEFGVLCKKVERSFTINNNSKNTTDNYLRCLASLTLHYKCSPEQLDLEQIKQLLLQRELL